MIPTFPLDPVLRVAQSNDKVESYETEVLVNQKGEALSGLLARLRAHRRYIVRADFEFNLRNREATLTDFANNQSIRIPYRCRGTIISSKTARAVEGLYDRSKSVTARLEEEIQTAMREWWEEKRGQLQTSVAIAVQMHRQDIQLAVTRKLLALGISLELVIDTDAAPVAPKEIGPFSFKVRVADFPDEELSLEMAVELRALSDRSGFVMPLPDADADRKEVLKVASREAILAKVSLHQFNHDRTKLEEVLKAALNALLRAYGWSVGWVIAKGGKPERPFRSYIDVKYEWPSLDGQRVPFSVRVEAHIDAEGEPIYARAGRPNLDQWFRQALEEETQKLLLQDELTALMPTYSDTLQRSLERGVQERAKAVGVKLRALVLLSSLPEWRYLQDFQTDVSDGTYTTKAFDLTVQFDVYVRGSFANRKDLKSLITGALAKTQEGADLISPQDKVREKLIEHTKEAAAFVMRTVNVEDYLVRFESAATPEGASVQDQIVRHVTHQLRDKLKFNASSVVVQQRDTDLIKFVRTFEAAQDHAIGNLVAVPVDQAFESEVFKVDVSIRLNGVSPAKTLMLWRKKTTPEDIWKMIAGWCQAELNSISRQVLLEFTTDAQHTLRARLDQALSMNAMDFFGADIRVIHLQVHAGEMRLAQNFTETLQREREFADYQLKRLRLKTAAANEQKALEHRSAIADIQREGRENEARSVARQQKEVIDRAEPEILTPEDIDLNQRSATLAEQADAESRPANLLDDSGLTLPGAPKPTTKAAAEKKPEQEAF